VKSPPDFSYVFVKWQYGTDGLAKICSWFLALRFTLKFSVPGPQKFYCARSRLAQIPIPKPGFKKASKLKIEIFVPAVFGLLAYFFNDAAKAFNFFHYLCGRSLAPKLVQS